MFARRRNRTTVAGRVEVYRRADDRWSWRVIAANGQIIATDGGQGFERRRDAASGATAAGRVLTFGEFVVLG